MISRILPTLLTAFVLCSCGPTDPKAETPTGPESLRLAPEPSFRVGAVASTDPAQHFTDVRNAILLPDGRVVVSVAGSMELRVFDPQGRHLASWGGRGGGPEEFSGLDEIRLLAPDSVVAHDYRRGLAVLGPTGKWEGSVRMSTPLSLVAGVMEGRRAVVYRDFAVATEGSSQGDDVFVVIQGEAGDTLVEVGPFPGTVEFFLREPPASASAKVPFSPKLHVTARGDLVALGHSARPEVEILSRDGQPLSTAHLVHRRQAVSDDLERAYLEVHAPKPTGVWRRLHEAALESAPVPDSVPWFVDLKLTAEGDLWVRQASGAPDGQLWWRFSRTGEPQGHVSLPDPRWRVEQVERDRVLIRRFGDFDEPLFEVYELVPGDATRDRVGTPHREGERAGRRSRGAFAWGRNGG